MSRIIRRETPDQPISRRSLIGLIPGDSGRGSPLREKARMPPPEGRARSVERVPTLKGGDEWPEALFLWKKPRAGARGSSLKQENYLETFTRQEY
jgi:hypothetical protein